MNPLLSVETAEPPVEWPRVALGDVCTVVSGATPKTKVPEFWDGDIVWITPTDLGKLDGRDIVESERVITEAGFASCSTTLMEPGAVVMSSRAPIGHLGVARVPLCTNQGCKSFVPGPNVDTDYLYYALRFSVPAIQDLGTGATFKEVSKSKLSRFQIPLPSLDTQREVAATLRSQLELATEARTNLEAQLAAAQSLPEAYLTQAFRGVEASRRRGVEASRRRGGRRSA
ncbi:restriction endonuclease subunit S [Rubrivirga litoralis]|uniref:Restriction endonuclease subunit S n=1 Tax=Rubrivirga litoralis TaxID=3075598 RepID=A0ABU3BRN8_9BACT|nr:restriction endonuclease subunit S [Rubrivirga sp. F394]MDT0631952.1 restriction endonuclease subunit S [Rubrivirga sp. F394]